MTHQQLKEWEERFDREFELDWCEECRLFNPEQDITKKLKSFIAKELLSLLQRKSEEIEGLRKQITHRSKGIVVDQVGNHKCYDDECGLDVDEIGFNHALTSAQAILLKG